MEVETWTSPKVILSLSSHWAASLRRWAVITWLYLCACRRCGRRPLLGWDQRRFAWPTIQSDEGMSSSQTHPLEHRGGEARLTHTKYSLWWTWIQHLCYQSTSDNDPQSVYNYSLTLIQVMMLHPAPHRPDFKFQEITWTVNLDCEVQLAQTVKESWA